MKLIAGGLIKVLPVFTDETPAYFKSTKSLLEGKKTKMKGLLVNLKCKEVGEQKFHGFYFLLL